jgi:hypothetical protein
MYAFTVIGYDDMIKIPDTISSSKTKRDFRARLGLW